jgi:hypothetical protein
MLKDKRKTNAQIEAHLAHLLAQKKFIELRNEVRLYLTRLRRQINTGKPYKYKHTHYLKVYHHASLLAIKENTSCSQP